MAEPLEQRLQDLERLVVRQAERIEEMEQQLAMALRLARQALSHISTPQHEAA